MLSPSAPQPACLPLTPAPSSSPPCPSPSDGIEDAPGRILMDFGDNRLLGALFGVGDRHLSHIEQALCVKATPRGNRLAITGARPDCLVAERALRDLYLQVEKGHGIGVSEVEGAVRMAADRDGAWHSNPRLRIATRKRAILPRSATQARYITAMERNALVFGIGPAGTGKTYLAVALAVRDLLEGRCGRIILSRPAVEAGERLGFLPGDMREKIDPYLRPLYDALHDCLPAEQLMRRMQAGEIEIAPLAFMRGRTLANATVLLDEAQNCTATQMKMFLTRLGEQGRMVITGDLSQIDLPAGAAPGLQTAVGILEDLADVAVVRFRPEDVMRHPLVADILRAYGQENGGGDTPARREDGS